jgi:glucose/arabinose dehydrogenase
MNMMNYREIAVPDYITSVKNGWYGWPYSYYGKKIADPRCGTTRITILMQKPLSRCSRETTSLEHFYTGTKISTKYETVLLSVNMVPWNRANFQATK